MPNDLILPRISSARGIAAPAQSGNWLVACIGFLLGLCIFGLMHNLESLGTDEAESVEAGAGIESQEDFEADVNAAPLQKKIGFVGLAMLGVFCFLTTPRGGRLGDPYVIVVCSAFLLWIMASTLWSADKTQTIREIIRILVYIFSCVSIVRRFCIRDVLKIIIVCMLVSIGIVYAGEIAVGTFRPWASDFRMHGSIHSSSLAHHALVLALGASALAMDSPKKRLWQALLAFAMVTILFSKTRGGLAATILGLLLIQALRFKPRTNLFFAVALVAGIAMVVMVSEVGGPRLWNRIGSTVALGRSEGVSTLTGRLPLWAVVWEDSKDVQLFGAGYGAFWTTKRTYSLAGMLEWFPRHSHNAYLETIVDLGFIGLLLLILMIVVSLVISLRLYLNSRNVVYAFVAGLIAAGIIDGFVEVIFVSIRELGLFVGLALCMLMFRHPADCAPVASKLGQRPFAKNNIPPSTTIPS